jgi:predicted NUDIX family NTP pyrophosphohydrolase
MSNESAGLLLYRKQGDELRVLLGHMGGPQYARKEAGAWSVPKGKPEAGESLLEAAFREFEEEVGLRPEGKPWPLTSIVQRSGKRVHAWAMEGELDVALLRSNLYELEWPPRSGKIQHYPELDRIAWLTVAEACELAISGQAQLFLEVERKLGQVGGR